MNSLNKYCVPWKSLHDHVFTKSPSPTRLLACWWKKHITKTTLLERKHYAQQVISSCFTMFHQPFKLPQVFCVLFYGRCFSRKNEPMLGRPEFSPNFLPPPTVGLLMGCEKKKRMYMLGSMNNHVLIDGDFSVLGFLHKRANLMSMRWLFQLVFPPNFFNFISWVMSCPNVLNNSSSVTTMERQQLQ